MFTACFCYVSHGNATISCYEESFRELGAVKLSPSANRKPLPYENKPRTGASLIVACLVLSRIKENVLKSCAMRAKEKKSGKNGEN